MKTFWKWFDKHKATILKVIFVLPICSAIFVSISHCIIWYTLTNPSFYAVFMSIAIELASAVTLIGLLVGRINFSMILTFILVAFIQILGNSFFSFNYINVESDLFLNWQQFTGIILSENLPVIESKFWLALLSGSTPPLLSLFSIHLITNFKLKEEKREESNAVILPEPIEEATTVVEPVTEEILSPKLTVQPSKPVVEKKVVKPNIEDFIELPEKKTETAEEIISEPVVEIPVENEETPIKTEPEVESIPVDEEPSPVSESVSDTRTLYFEDMGKPLEVTAKPKKRFFPKIQIKK
jgi:hypothetical protein